MSNLTKRNNEKEFLTLLCEIQTALHTGLKERKAKSARMAEEYLYQQSDYLSQLLDGFIDLTKARNFRAARVIIRPCLEAVFKMQAVAKKPSYLYNVVQTEHEGDVKLVGIAVLNGEFSPDTKDPVHPEWEKAKTLFKQQFPADQLTEHAASAYDCAQTAGLIALYDFQYRWYCNSAHSALRASSADIEVSRELDNETMVRCGFVALGALGTIGVPILGFAQLVNRFKNLPTKGAQQDCAPTV